jgi:hypothetical protein
MPPKFANSRSLSRFSGVAGSIGIDDSQNGSRYPSVAQRRHEEKNGDRPEGWSPFALSI